MTFDRLDRGVHGIICFACRGHGYLLAVHMATGEQRRAPCLDCKGTGHVKHCIACVGTGKIEFVPGHPSDCPECQGKGYPLPKRQFFTFPDKVS